MPGDAVEAMEQHPRRARLFGILLAVLGVACIAFPWVSTLAAQTLIAACLVAAGAVEIAHAVSSSAWTTKTRTISGIAGLLALGAGGILILFPLSGLLTLTLFVSAAFLVAGAMRLAVAASAEGREGRGWLALSGGLSILLSVLIFIELPMAALWVLGLVLGADLIAHGIALIALTGAVRRAAERRDDEERVDQAGWESFPASDPPGFGR